MSKHNLTRRQTLAGLIALPAGAALLSRPANAATPSVYMEEGIAWDGHDPVAYFTKGAPMAGSAEFTTMYEGATVYFASAESRDMFIADPMAYAPQYGGYCAFAMSKGYIAPTVPEAWTIVDGKLYLNFSLRARELWLKDVPGNIAKGDANWPDILNT